MTANGAASELKAALAKLTGDIADFRVRQLGDNLNAEFLHATERNGTKTARNGSRAHRNRTARSGWRESSPPYCKKPPVTLIGIEEPELTVHVGAIPLLYDYLKQAALRSGAVDNPLRGITGTPGY